LILIEEKIKNKTAKVVSQIFSDVLTFTIVALDEKEILAEKIRELVRRPGKSTLMYQMIGSLLEKGADPNQILFVAKTKSSATGKRPSFFCCSWGILRKQNDRLPPCMAGFLPSSVYLNLTKWKDLYNYSNFSKNITKNEKKLSRHIQA
jgi:hypothetical protein